MDGGEEGAVLGEVVVDGLELVGYEGCGLLYGWPVWLSLVRRFYEGKLGWGRKLRGNGGPVVYQEGRGSVTSRSRRSELSAVVSWRRR